MVDIMEAMGDEGMAIMVEATVTMEEVMDIMEGDKAIMGVDMVIMEVAGMDIMVVMEDIDKMLYGQHKAWSLYYQSQLYFVIILYLYLLITNSFLINFLLLFWIWRFFCKYYFVLHLKNLKSKFTKCTGNMLLEIMIMCADYDSNLLQGYN